MTAGQIAALIAAGAFVVLVLLLAVPLLKLGRTLDEATIAIRKAHEGSAPLLDDAQITLRQVNTQLERVDGITSSARTVTQQRVRADLALHRHARRPPRPGRRVLLRPQQGHQGPARRQGRGQATAARRRKRAA